MVEMTASMADLSAENRGPARGLASSESRQGARGLASSKSHRSARGLASSQSRRAAGTLASWAAGGLASLLLLGLPSACTTTPLAPSGACARDLAVEATCGSAIDGGTPAALGLAGYSCTGSARPDDSPAYVQGVPQGMVCANQPAPDGGASAGGNAAYCCTTASTPCAYNPVAICNAGTFGYQCRGSTRPESFNVELTCEQGVFEGDLIDYCCSGTGLSSGCQEKDTLNCAAGLTGWLCPSNVLPRGEDLGANKSRADNYYLLCPVPTASLQAGYDTFCCYPPAVTPPGSSCVQDTTVPGCAPGRFGFACYGPDKPEQSYLPMNCPDPGVPGTSYQGYPATLYCCDFVSG